MKRTCVLTAIVLAGLGSGRSSAQEVNEVPMSEYTKHLLEVYGDTGVIIAGTINGKTKDGIYMIDNFPSPDPNGKFPTSPIKSLSLQRSEAPCDTSQIITRPTSGAYAYPWCARYETINSTPYEAKRDTMYYSGGRWTYVVSNRFDCQNSSDLAQMPTSVSTAVCSN
jgi:hypothetical protein